MKTNIFTTRKRRLTLIAGIAVGLIAPVAVSSGSLHAAGATQATTKYYNAGTSTSIKGIKVSGWEGQRIYAAVTTDQPTVATLSLTTTTDLTLPFGYFKYSGNRIAFVGTQEAVNAALATLSLTMPTSTTSSAVKIETTVFKDTTGLAYNPANQHFYRFIPGKISGTNAHAAASTHKEFGLTGYLASISSADENDFVGNKIEGASNVWIGATDLTKEGEWKWVGGPEGDKLFWSGNCKAVDGKAVDGSYTQWATGEPNNWISDTNKCGGTTYDINSSSLGEDCVVTNWRVTGVLPSEYVGYWNDLPCSLEVNWDRTPIGGYVVEFGSKTNGSTYDSSVNIQTHTLVKAVPSQRLDAKLGRLALGVTNVAKTKLSRNFDVFAKKLKTKLTAAQILPCPKMERTRIKLTLRTAEPGDYYFYFRNQKSQRVPLQCGSNVGKNVIPEPVSVPVFKTKKSGETISVTAYLKSSSIENTPGYPQLTVVRGDPGRGGKIINQQNPPLPGMPIK
ncbi:MAG: hypothetical protein FGM42_01295 [Ilumatobacteraceae bacterium]|nr:hypothetical protein [Ilumatobacteraceae bacterium]